MRFESIEEALNIEHQLKQAWSGHPHFHLIKAYDSIEHKFTEFNKIVLGIITEE